ncbi:MAG: cobalamin-binding protein [Deltaproteobacteria bacterium]|nr:cobalamin-binding protein [Deltaproteobacteria bacterium]
MRKYLFVFMAFLLVFTGSLYYFKPHTENTNKPHTLQDELGRSVTLPESKERLISLAPNITEILFALGMGSSVVGVSDFSDYPPEAVKLPKVGGFAGPNIELIAELKPDLVIATADGNPEQSVTKLNKISVPSFVINPRSYDGIVQSIGKLGIILDRKEVAEKIAEAMNATKVYIQTQVTPLKQPKVLFQLNAKPIMSANKNTFVHDLISIAGGINIAAESGINYPKLNAEAIVQKNPDIIIVASDENQFKVIQEQWKTFSSVSAVKNKKIYHINPNIILRPSPRVTQGLIQLFKIFHIPTSLEKNKG